MLWTCPYCTNRNFVTYEHCSMCGKFAKQKADKLAAEKVAAAQPAKATTAKSTKPDPADPGDVFSCYSFWLGADCVVNHLE